MRRTLSIVLISAALVVGALVTTVFYDGGPLGSAPSPFIAAIRDAIVTQIEKQFAAFRKQELERGLSASQGRAVLCDSFFRESLIGDAQSVGLDPQLASECRFSYRPGELLVKVKAGEKDPLGVVTSLARTRGAQETKPLLKRNAVKTTAVAKNVARQPVRAGAVKAAADRAAQALERTYLLRFSQNADVGKLAESFRARKEIEYAEPNAILTAQVTPNDPYFGTSGAWGQSHRDLWGLESIRAPQAWETSTGSSTIIVAVSDTGIDYTHPDLAGQLWQNPNEVPGNGIDDDGNGYVDDVYGYDFTTCAYATVFGCSQPKNPDSDPMDDHGHGTHVAGTIAAATNNALGVSGVAWNVKLMAVKGLNAQGAGSVTDLANTIYYAAANGASVINMSWGGVGGSPTISAALSYAASQGVTLVAAAGNSNTDTASFMPANDENVIAVAAWRPDGVRASFSNWGEKVDVTAPGVSVLSLRAGSTDMYGDGTHVVGGTYYWANGTSMASPHVAGVAALIRSAAPTLTPVQVRQVLRLSAQSVLGGGKTIDAGYGLVDAAAALPLASRIASGESRAELIGDGATAQAVATRTTEPLAISFTVKNIGTANAPATDYGLYLEKNNTTSLVGTGSVPAITANGSVSITTTGTLPDLFMRGSKLIARFDEGNVVGEYDNGNNTLAVPLTFSVLRPPYPIEQTTPSNQRYLSDSRGTIYIPYPSNNIGAPAVADVNGDGAREIIFEGNGAVGLMSMTNSVPWWRTLIPTPVFPKSPGIVDINSDGILDVVAPATDGTVHVLHGATGATLPGWPVVAGAGSYSGFPAIGDIDPLSPGSEIIVSDRTTRVYALHADGTPVSGWPTEPLAFIPSQYVIGEPYISLADVDRNGILDVIAIQNTTDPVGLFITVLNTNGQPLPGWPKTLIGEHYLWSDAAAAVADIDRDGAPEIIVAGYTNRGEIRIFKADGTLARSISLAEARSHLYSAPVLANIYGDAAPEIIVKGYNGLVYVLDAVGNRVPGWPRASGPTTWQFPASPAVADLDGNGTLEIIDASSNGRVSAFYADGTLVPGFPFQNPFETVSSPAIADLDGNGTLEVMIGGISSGHFIVRTLPWVVSGNTAPWREVQYTIQRTSALADSVSENSAPVLQNPGPQTVREGNTLTVTLNASDENYDTLTFSAADMPAGALFDTAAGIFVWSPGFSQSGDYSVTFSVSDGAATDSKTVPIHVANVNRAPVFNTVSDIAAQENSVTLFTVSAADPDGDTLQYSATNLPSGASFNPVTREFSWVPPFGQAGTYALTFTASDGTLTDSASVTIVVGSTNRVPTLVPIGNKVVTEGNLLTFRIRGSDPNDDTLQYSATNLPPGASFSQSARTFSWRPGFHAEGTYYDVTFTVSDGMLTASESIRITVVRGNRPPVIAPVNIQRGTVGSFMTFTVSVTDPENDPVSVSALTVPPGARFDTRTKTFSWVPTAPGTFKATIVARDLIGHRVDHTLLDEDSDGEETISPALSREATLVVKIVVSRAAGGNPPTPTKPKATPLKGSLFEGVLQSIGSFFVPSFSADR